MKKLLLINALTLVTACAIAQTDITQYYLDNYGFDENFNYTSGQTNDVKEEIKEIEGWTADLSANYTIVGVYEYGFKGVFNTASVPASGYEIELPTIGNHLTDIVFRIAVTEDIRNLS